MAFVAAASNEIILGNGNILLTVLRTDRSSAVSADACFFFEIAGTGPIKNVECMIVCPRAEEHGFEPNLTTPMAMGVRWEMPSIMGGFNIWTVGTDGNNPVQLTHGNSDEEPACSPDGKWVVFDSFSGGQVAIWKIPLEGGPAVQLTDYTSEFPAVSPDAKWIAFLDARSLRAPKIAVMPVDGGSPVKTFAYTANLPGSPYFQWSPDGRGIDYVDDRKGVCNIWEQPLAGGPPKQVTHFDSGLIFDFAWSKNDELALARGIQTDDAVLIKNF